MLFGNDIYYMYHLKSFWEYWNGRIAESVRQETVIGLLIRSRKTGRFFLVKRNDKNRYWSLLSGGQDAADRNDMSTIRREMGEELMLNQMDIDIRPGGVELVKGGSRVFRWYMGWCGDEFSPHLDEENLDWGWFSPDPKGESMVHGSYCQGLPSDLYPGLSDKIRAMS
jgi:hypothetical protein